MNRQDIKIVIGAVVVGQVWMMTWVAGAILLPLFILAPLVHFAILKVEAICLLYCIGAAGWSMIYFWHLRCFGCDRAARMILVLADRNAIYWTAVISTEAAHALLLFRLCKPEVVVATLDGIVRLLR